MMSEDYLRYVEMKRYKITRSQDSFEQSLDDGINSAESSMAAVILRPTTARVMLASMHAGSFSLDANLRGANLSCFQEWAELLND
jgi:hypothetical protein